ncbi:hypothetical protein Tco_0340438 [Tanacetum coccineum]
MPAVTLVVMVVTFGVGKAVIDARINLAYVVVPWGMSKPLKRGNGGAMISLEVAVKLAKNANNNSQQLYMEYRKLARPEGCKL